MAGINVDAVNVRAEQDQHTAACEAYRKVEDARLAAYAALTEAECNMVKYVRDQHRALLWLGGDEFLLVERSNWDAKHPSCTVLTLNTAALYPVSEEKLES